MQTFFYARSIFFQDGECNEGSPAKLFAGWRNTFTVKQALCSCSSLSYLSLCQIFATILFGGMTHPQRKDGIKNDD